MRANIIPPFGLWTDVLGALCLHVGWVLVADELGATRKRRKVVKLNDPFILAELVKGAEVLAPHFSNGAKLFSATVEK